MVPESMEPHIKSQSLVALLAFIDDVTVLVRKAKMSQSEMRDREGASGCNYNCAGSLTSVEMSITSSIKASKATSD